MDTVVISGRGGLTFATALTLLLTPALIVAQARVGERWRMRRERRAARRVSLAAS